MAVYKTFAANHANVQSFENDRQFWVDIGNYIKLKQSFDKVNIGMLGNVVSQLHLHVVLRNKDDPAWPGPVWGWKSTSNLDVETKQIRSKLIFEFL